MQREVYTVERCAVGINVEREKERHNVKDVRLSYEKKKPKWKKREEEEPSSSPFSSDLNGKSCEGERWRR